MIFDVPSAIGLLADALIRVVSMATDFIEGPFGSNAIASGFKKEEKKLRLAYAIAPLAASACHLACGGVE
jgi:hypothetical protein